MRKILGITLATLATLMAIVPVVLPQQTQTATNTATISKTCDVQAAGVDFGALVPTGSKTVDTSVSQTNGGNTAAPLTIEGSAWTGGTGMPVGQTSWAVGTGSPVALTGSPASAGTLDPVTPTVVHLTLAVPAHQAAASYTQTITFAVSC